MATDDCNPTDPNQQPTATLKQIPPPATTSTPTSPVPLQKYFSKYTVGIHDGHCGNKVDGLFGLRRFEQNGKSNSWPGPQYKTKSQQTKKQVAK